MTEEEKKILQGAKSATVTEESYNQPFSPEMNGYQVKPFSPEEEGDAYNNSQKTSAFRSLMSERDTKLVDYALRHQKNAESAKALAWGNLITNLAKLGGWGYAPVVKEDNAPLMKAFAEVDRMRELYDRTSDAYNQAGRQMRQNYIESARAAHNASEKAKWDAEQKRVDLINEAALKNRAKTTTKRTYEDSSMDKLKEQKIRAEIASINARRDLTKQQKAKLIKEAEDKASGADKKPFYSYAGKDGYTYNLTKSQAQDIVTKLKQDKNNPPEGLSQQYLDKLDKDIGLLETALKYGQSDNATLAIIAEYLSSNPERFQDILSRSNRVTTKSNVTFTPDTEEEEEDIDTAIF